MTFWEEVEEFYFSMKQIAFIVGGGAIGLAWTVLKNVFALTVLSIIVLLPILVAKLFFSKGE